MSYIALYRKYRPSNFDEVVGQDAIIRTLRNAINQDKIAHAYLFCGPRGTGKTSVAKIFAMAVNCTSNEKPCMECDSCKAFLEGDSPDVIEIDAASNNGVDEVRELIDKVKYAPQVSKYKVYIIDEVHMMSISAFNALLKTIEEPPKHVIFILATTDPHKVIPTIISRCQRYDFNSVSLDTMSSRLVDVMKMEDIEFEDGVVERISLLSEGGMRDALSILDQVVAYSGNYIQSEDIDVVYGSLNSVDLCNYLEYIINNDIDRLFSFLQEIESKGIDTKRMTQDLVNLIKNILFYSYTNDRSNIKFMDSDQIERILSNIDRSKLIRLSESLIEANEKMKSTSDVDTYFELVSLKMVELANQNVSRETSELKQNTYIDNVSRETLEENKQIENIEKLVNEEYSKEIDVIDNKIEVIEDKQEETSDSIYTKENELTDVIEDSDENIETSEEIIEDEFLLQLLISANKEYKAEITEKYERIMDYANDFEWVKQANVLRNIEIAAAGENYIIVKTANKIHAELIHDKKSERSFQMFMKELFGRYMHIYALSSKDVNELINTFISRRQEGTLPVSIQLSNIELEDTIEEVNETEKKAIELFGNDNFIMEE